MIQVEKVWEGIRGIGLNYGLPVAFVKLGPGGDYATEELLGSIVSSIRSKWVTILGENTTRVGMGTLVKGLVEVGYKVELEVSSEYREPGWFSYVDRWLVDWLPTGAFNLGALRGQDMIRIGIQEDSELGTLSRVLEELKNNQATRVLLVREELVGQVFPLIRNSDRIRIFPIRR